VAVVFKYCKLYYATESRFSSNTVVRTKLQEFLRTKQQNPLQKFGSKDYPFHHAHLSGYLHAGLTNNLSILYSISGSNPHVIKLYGIFTHDELGIGQPANIKIQKQMSKQLSNQVFESVPTKADVERKIQSLDRVINDRAATSSEKDTARKLKFRLEQKLVSMPNDQPKVKTKTNIYFKDKKNPERHTIAELFSIYEKMQILRKANARLGYEYYSNRELDELDKRMAREYPKEWPKMKRMFDSANSAKEKAWKKQPWYVKTFPGFFGY